MKNIGKIIVFTKSFWKLYVFMGLFVVVTSFLGLVVPFLMKLIVDEIVAQISGNVFHLDLVIRYLILILVTDIFITVLTSFSTWIGDILATRMQTFLSRKFYEHILRLEISFFDKNITGNLVNKMYRGIESVTDFINMMTNNFLPFFFTAFVTILLLSRYSLVIALLLSVLFPLYILISHKSTLAWGGYEEKKNSIADTSQGRVAEAIGGIRVVKAFVGELFERTAFANARKEIETLTVKQTREWHWYDFLRRLVLNIIIFAITAYVLYYTYTRRYTVGEMTFLLQLVNQARFPLFAMSFILGQIQRAEAGSKDYFDILAEKTVADDIPGAHILHGGGGRANGKADGIQFSDITFGYDEAKTVLKGVSFSLPKGKTLALVGESGQGKSTLVNLLLRFYAPDSGVIKMFNEDIHAITLESLRREIAVVFQESLLFSGSIYENILYGKPDATREEVIHAVKTANADEFIEELPEKYQTVVGERGVKLSGGQKQRIAIARAILKDAPVVVMDEATSSLDSRSELQVQEGLKKLLENKTAIIIAHRLSTISNADYILVIENGLAAQWGKPETLLKDKKGLYSRMVTLQKTLLTATPEERVKALAKYDLVG